MFEEVLGSKKEVALDLKQNHKKNRKQKNQSNQKRILGYKELMKSLINQEEKYDQIEMNPNQLKIEETQDEGYSNSNQIIQSQLNDTKKTNKWTSKEDEALKKLVQSFGEKNWRKISGMMEGRSAIQCLHRWSKILKPGLVKGPWTAEEDEKLIYWVQQYGPYKWSQCSELITGRSGKQCRERWFNNLNPNVKKGNWTQEEDNAIFRGYLSHGSSWSKIAKNLEGRTENSVKNRFYSTVRKLLSDMEKKGKYVNQDNECDIKNIIQQSLSEYNSSQNIIKLLNEDQDQDNQQRRKSSTATNSASGQECNENNMNLTMQNEDQKEENNQQKLEIQQTKNQININDGMQIQQSYNNEKDGLLQGSEAFQQEMEKDEIQKEQFQILNKEFTQNQQYENGNQEQQNRQNSEDNLQKQNNQSMNSQNTNLNQTNPNLQLQQFQLKLKDEYSQQNCLYRLILEGNVSIKKTTSMRDYSLYQKNKAKTRSKKYQKEQSDDYKKGMQHDENSASSQRSQDQYPLSFNSQHSLLQNGQMQKGNINYELSKEEKLMIQVQQFHKLDDMSQNQLKVLNEQLSIKQKISQNELNSKNLKLQKKQILSQLGGKNNVQVQNGKNNNSNLSYLLKEKLMSLNQLSKLKNGDKRREDSESRDESLSQDNSEDYVDYQTKKNNSKQQIPTVLEQAQKLQKEIEEKQKQLLLLSLEGKVDKKKQKKGYYDQNDDIKNKQSDTQQKGVKVKEEFDEEYAQSKEKSDFNFNKRQSKSSKVQIDHEQQKQIFQKMLQSQQNKKLVNSSEADSQMKEEKLQNNKLNNLNKKLQSQLKLLDTLKSLKLSNKPNKTYDSSESDDQNQTDEDEENQIDDEDEDNFDENEIDQEEEDDEEEEDEDEQEEDEENENGSDQMQNKLMKYLSSSFAKMMHSITQKYSKKYQQAKQNKVNKKNAIKQQAHKQKSLEQMLQAQQFLQKNSHNLASQKFNNCLQDQIISKKNKSLNGNTNSQIYQFEKNNNKKLKKDSEIASQSENKAQSPYENINKQKQKQQIAESKDKWQGSSKNADFNQAFINSQQPKFLQQDFKQEEIQQQIQASDKTKKQTTKKNKIQQSTQNTQNKFSNENKQQSENYNEQVKQNQNSQMEIESMSLHSERSIKPSQLDGVVLESNKNVSNNRRSKVDMNRKNSGNIIQQELNENIQINDQDVNPPSSNTPNQETTKRNNSQQAINSEMNQVSNKDQQQINNREMLNISQETFISDLSKQNLNQNKQKLKQNQDQQIYKANNNTKNTNINDSLGMMINTLQNKMMPNQSNNNAFQSILSQIPKDASKSDDRIDYLINQLQSLENLLNTTKQELNKLESTIKEPEQNLQHNQSPTHLHNDEMINMGILSNHNLNFINFSQYHQNNLSSSLQAYNHSDDLDCQLNHQPSYKQQNQNFEGGSNQSNNMNQTHEEDKFHDNNQNHISDINSVDFAFDHKYSTDDMNYIGSQEHEKDVYHLGNITPSPMKEDQFNRHKDNNQHIDSSQNIQEKSVDDSHVVNAETESENSILNKKDSSKTASFKQIV